MNVLVFGATGKTGNLVVERALAEGHQVTALVRNAAKITQPSANVVVGDATNLNDVRKAMHSQHVVIDTVGGTTPYKTTQLESNVARNIIAAMRAESVRRLIVVTMMGLGESRDQAPFWYKHLLMTTFLRGSTKDKAAAESEVRTSGLDYTIVRPPILTETPSLGAAKIIGTNATGHKITRIDLANFLVAQMTDDRYLGQAVTVVNS
jgi:putative NADH-flavin reductase